MFNSVSLVRRGEIETILAAEGFQGWTWSRTGGRTTLRLVSVPQWGGDPVVDRLLAEKLRMRFSFDSSYTQSIHEVNVSVMNKPGKGEPTYQSFLESK